MDQSKVAANMRRLRESRGKDVAWMVERTGWSKSKVYRVEAGEQQITVEIVDAYAKALRCPVSEVLGQRPRRRKQRSAA